MDSKLISTIVTSLLAMIAGLYWLFSLEANATIQENKIVDLVTHLSDMEKQFNTINNKLDELNSKVSYIKGRLEKK